MLKFFKVILLIISFSTTAQVANFDWVKIIGSKNSDEASDIAIDKWGNVYVTGGIADTCDMDPGAGVFNLISGAFIAKYDSMGSLRWAVRFEKSSSAFQNPAAIEVDTSGFVYVCGTFGDVVDFDPGVATYTLNGNAQPSFILKLDSASNFIWAKQFGQAAFEMAIDKSSNLYLSGYGINGGDFDPGPGFFSLPFCGVYAIKVNSNGNLIWARSFGASANTDYAQTIGVDKFGAVYIGGIYKNTADFDPGPAVFNLSSINFGAFLVKLNSSGNFVWARAVPATTLSTTTAHAETKDIAFGPNTEVYFGGDFNGTLDFDFGPGVYNLTSSSNEGFITKLDTAGNLSWAVTTGGEVIALKCDDTGDIYTVGNLGNYCDFDPGPLTYSTSETVEFYISRLTPSANFVWAYAYGPIFLGYVNAMAIDAVPEV